MTDIIILGAGGNCLDILDLLEDVNRAGGETEWRCLGFLDDDRAKWGTEAGGAKVLGPLSLAREHPGVRFVNGIGSAANFWRKPAILAATGLAPDRFATLVHPLASVARTARLGPGTVIFPQASVGARARVGAHVLALPGAVISHDAQVGDYACLAAGAVVAGNARIGACCYLGARCAVGDVAVGAEALVGMGAVVIEDVPGNSVVVGNPARFLRKTRDGAG